MFTKLRNRLTLIFIGLAIMPLLVTGTVFAQRTFNQRVDESIQHQQLLGNRFSVSIQDTLTERVNELTLLGNTIFSGELTDNAQDNLATSLLVRGEAYQDIAVVDANGQERLKVSRTGIVSAGDLTNRTDDDVYKDVLAKGETRISPVFIDERTGQPLLTIAVPFFDLRTGHLNHTILANFRFRIIWDLVAQLKTQINEDMDVFLTDAEGLIVAHANPTIVLRNTEFHTHVENNMGQGLDGNSALITQQSLNFGNQQFIIVVEESLNSALQPATEAVIGTLIITLITLLVTGAVVTFVTGQIVHPIEQLSKTAVAIRDGDLNARTNVTRKDEIGVLGRSFDAMTARLQDLIRNLETRVNERVRDLDLAAEVSRQVTTKLDTNQLFKEVADLTAKAFNLYHVSIFLYDKDRQLLKLEQGTGMVGNQMRASGKQFHLNDQGLVPNAARKHAPVLSNDVAQDKHYFRNPMLPLTQSELAVPMLYQDELLGILDLQAEKTERFQTQDVRVITTLAEQIAIAVHNAQQFGEVESARAAAERANEVKSAFLASMSHELRTPLNAVINFTQFVIDGDAGDITPEQTDLLGEVVGSAKHLLDLINDVLDMSKIEAGSLKLFVEDNINLNNIINRVVSTGRSLLRDKAIQVKLDADPDLPLIRGDQQRIFQILLNIMSNACKFTEAGEITVQARLTDQEVVLSIEDTGPGIAAEDKNVVFEPFKQTKTGLRQGGGTGLGMPIAKNLAEAHGGRLWLDSAVGQGTTFYVALPIKSEMLVPVL